MGKTEYSRTGDVQVPEQPLPVEQEQFRAWNLQSQGCLRWSLVHPEMFPAPLQSWQSSGGWSSPGIKSLLAAGISENCQ